MKFLADGTLWVADGGLLLEDSTANPPNFNYERGNGANNVGNGARCGDQSVLLKGGSVFRVIGIRGFRVIPNQAERRNPAAISR